MKANITRRICIYNVESCQYIHVSTPVLARKYSSTYTYVLKYSLEGIIKVLCLAPSFSLLFQGTKYRKEGLNEVEGHPQNKKKESTTLLFRYYRAIDGARTRDLWLGKPKLYQLSYYRVLLCKDTKK